MVLLLIFALLAGFFTVLSPCILPILPILLSAGTTKGRYRPLGIIIGLVVSFTFFTLALTALVHTLGLSANVLRYIAIGFIFFFGLVMIFPGLSNWFAKITSPVANLGQHIAGSGEKSGFGGGILFGIALGLLWTPCAGPILAAITTLVATQGVNFTVVLITLTYSIGAGFPMFLIAYGGGKIIQSSKTLAAHSERIRQFFGCLMILTAIAIARHWDTMLQQKVSAIVPSVIIENNPVVKAQLDKLQGEQPEVRLGKLGKAPELTGIVNWINSPPLTLEELRGKVVLIDFWTYSCINCLRTLPYLEKWYADYKDAGFVIIGVHTPEFEFEKDPANVEAAAKRLGVVYPIAQDNNYKTWEAYHNHYWPAHYLIDQEGNIREAHNGEGEYVATENAIRELLGLSPLDMKEPSQSMRRLSPETYLGTSRGSSYASLTHEFEGDYDYEAPLGDNKVGLRGLWTMESDRITAESDHSYLDMNYLAKQVYLVLAGTSSTPVEVFIDGTMIKKFVMDGNRKYDIATAAYGRHLVSIKIPAGISAYAFTFGDD